MVIYNIKLFLIYILIIGIGFLIFKLLHKKAVQDITELDNRSVEDKSVQSEYS
jgi:hypothetical protein